MFLSKLKRTTAHKWSPLLWSVPIAVLMLPIFASPAEAAGYNTKIRQLQHSNASAAQSKQNLSNQANSLSATIAAQQAEIAALTSQINQSKTKIDGLQQDIAKAEADLAQQKQLLGINMRMMYTEGDTSTLEMLASSKNFSTFFDRAEYRTSVQSKIDATTKRIEELTQKLNGEKQAAQNLLADQQAMQSRLDGQRAENSRLLGMNLQQQMAYASSMDSNNAQIAALRRQQSSLNDQGFVSYRKPAGKFNARSARSFVTASYSAPQSISGDRYPWANAPFPNSMSDPWGMYKRQCVSYTAWKVAASGRHMPYWGGSGNAKQWVGNAQRSGIPVDHSPRTGDVAISVAGAYGHAMYVEAVNGDGTISVSQYNAHWDGRYSVGRRAAAGLFFLHF